MSASGPVRVDRAVETRAGPGADFSWSLDLLFMPPDLLISCTPRHRTCVFVAGGIVTTRTLGILATAIGSAIGAWWWTRLQNAAARRRLTPPRERGTVIFDNTPAANSEAAL